MAEAYSHTRDMIECQECGEQIDVSGYDSVDFESEIQEFLHEDNDLCGLYEHRFEFAPILAEVPVTVPCPKCYTDTELYVEVEPEPVWSDDLERDRDPEVDYFDIVNFNTVNDHGRVNEIEIRGFKHSKSIREVRLRIICKTTMNQGHCYIGYDENNQKLVRPIFRTETGQCCWPGYREFEIGAGYKFDVLYDPDIPSLVEPPTPYPHRHDDLLVSESISQYGSKDSWLPNILENVAHIDIRGIFPANDIKERKYVYENTQCPSVGILKKEESKVHLREICGKWRMRINEFYDFPVRQTSPRWTKTSFSLTWIRTTIFWSK